MPPPLPAGRIDRRRRAARQVTTTWRFPLGGPIGYVLGREQAADLTSDSDADTTDRQSSRNARCSWDRQRRDSRLGRTRHPLPAGAGNLSPDLRDGEDPAEGEPGHPIGTRRVGGAQPRGEFLPEVLPFLC